MSVDLLPDSRTRSRAGGKYHKELECWLVPVWCANCGVPYGYVPEHNFACWLCNACVETHGLIAGTMLMPDEILWQTVQDEMMDKHGRHLTTQELEDDFTLRLLLREKPKGA